MFILQRILLFIVWFPLIFFLFTQQLPAMDLSAVQPNKQHDEPGSAYDITQDQHDFLWLASEYDGLLRFDGESYLRFSPPEELTTFSYSQVEISENDQLWIGTWGHGLWQLDNTRQQWQQMSGDLPADAQIQTLFLDSNQNLWIGTTDGLFVLYVAATTPERWQPLAGERIWQLAEQADGRLWVATSAGLYQLSADKPGNGDWFTDAELENEEIRSVNVTGHSLLIGQREGITEVDLRSGSYRQYSTPANSNAILTETPRSWLVGTIDGLYRLTKGEKSLVAEPLLPAIDIRKLYKDKSGTIWLTSRNNGVLQLPSTAPQLINPPVQQFINPTQQHRLGPPSTTSTARWQALENSLLQLRDMKWRKLQFSAEHKVAYVRDVVEFNGVTLVGTDQGLFRVEHNNSLTAMSLNEGTPKLNIERMALAPDGSLWLGLWGQGVYRIAPVGNTPIQLQHNKLPAATQMLEAVKRQDSIIDIQTDPKQQLWLVSRQGRLFKGGSDKMKLSWQPPPELATGYFQCMLAEADALWFCTDRGLLKLSPDLQQAELFGLSWGLPDLRVIGITKTKQFIWVLTRGGILAFKPDGSDFQLLSPKKELNFAAAQLRGISALDDETVQLATSEGLWQLNPADLTPVPATMQLHLTELRLNHQFYGVTGRTKSIRLPDNIQEIQLKFKLLSYQSHLRVNYFYRWQTQHDWIDLGKDAVLTVGQLAPGQHKLEVMALTAGQKIQTGPIILDVPVPWWRQPASMMLFAVTFLLALYVAHKFRVNRIQQYTTTLDLLVKQRTAELETANQQLRQLSHTDSLTGLMNRRALQYAAQLLQTQRNRSQLPMTLALMDIDHFKDINDNYGHDTGDQVLVLVASYLQQRLRNQDLLARWGGEEFLLLMPNTSVEQATQLVNELRLGIRTLTELPSDIALSATFGLSHVEATALGLEQAIKQADKALYEGKSMGRDQVVQA